MNPVGSGGNDPYHNPFNKNLNNSTSSNKSNSNKRPLEEGQPGQEESKKPRLGEEGGEVNSYQFSPIPLLSATGSSSPRSLAGRAQPVMVSSPMPVSSPVPKGAPLGYAIPNPAPSGLSHRGYAPGFYHAPTTLENPVNSHALQRQAQLRTPVGGSAPMPMAPMVVPVANGQAMQRLTATTRCTIRITNPQELLHRGVRLTIRVLVNRLPQPPHAMPKAPISSPRNHDGKVKEGPQ